MSNAIKEVIKDPMPWLYRSLIGRPIPENVAYVIVNTPGLKFTEQERRTLKSIASPIEVWMPPEFRSPVRPDRQLCTAGALFGTPLLLKDAEGRPENMLADLECIQAYITTLYPYIKKKPGKNSFKEDRVTRRTFKRLGLSRRRYNRMFRFLTRLDDKLDRYGLEVRKYVAVLMSKSGLAHAVTKREFDANPYAGAFMAYYTARCKRRSVFTNSSQDRPFDVVSQMLLNKAFEEGGIPAMRGIAKVMPHQDVLGRLRDRDKLELLSMSIWTLHDIAEMLKKVWEKSHFDRTQMIVKRGDDSSTWNALAGAWNSCRSSWISLNHSLGLDEAVNKMCIGKVMRLMAGDVAWWHRSLGGDLDPNTKVWAELPAPWQVISGKAVCTAEIVEEVCRRNGVDPRQSGWICPPPSSRVVVPFKPTPNLVHGVTVENPKLARLLQKAGVFSGKALKASSLPSFKVKRDKHGYALKAKAVR